MRLPSLLPRSLAGLVCLFALGLGLLLPLSGQAAETKGKDGELVTCPTCRGKGDCHVRDCKEGKVPCAANCLKPDSPAWTKRQIEGQSEADAEKLWYPYEYKVGGKKEFAYFPREQAGELIEMEKGKPIARGRCKNCQGSGTLTCRSCKGTDKCASCLGEKVFVRGQNLFTLADAQGREIEAVVRARKADRVTILRLADLQVFDIPLDKFSAESTERIEQRFPLEK